MVKIWKWLKLLKSVPFIKKTLVNQVYIRIWSSWMTFTVLQWMKKNSTISQFSSFLLRSGSAILVKIWQWLKLLNSVPFIKYMIQVKIWKWLKLLNSVLFIKKILINHVYIWIWSSWLTFTVLQLMKKNLKISQVLKISPKVQVCDSGQNLKMTKTSLFCFIHQENTCKSSLHSNLLNLTDFHSFSVNEENLHN